TKASWTGFMSAVREFLPFLRRALSWLKRVLGRAIPFIGGFAIGTVVGVFKGAGFGVVALFRPLAQAFERESDARVEPSEAQIGAGLVLALTLVPLALGVGALGLVVGAAAALPFALVSGAAWAGHWAHVGPKSEKFYQYWENTALPRVAARATAANA